MISYKLKSNGNKGSRCKINGSNDLRFPLLFPQHKGKPAHWRGTETVWGGEEAALPLTGTNERNVHRHVMQCVCSHYPLQCTILYNDDIVHCLFFVLKLRVMFHVGDVYLKVFHSFKWLAGKKGSGSKKHNFLLHGPLYRLLGFIWLYQNFIYYMAALR